MARLAWREIRRLWPAILAVLLLVGGLTTAAGGRRRQRGAPRVASPSGRSLVGWAIVRDPRRRHGQVLGRNEVGQLGLGDVVDRGDGPGDEMGDALPTVDLGADAMALQRWWRPHLRPARQRLGEVLGPQRVRGARPRGYRRPRGRRRRDGGRPPPVDLGTGRFATAVTAGRPTRCALLDNGSVKCWGVNAPGQLGLGDTDAPRGRRRGDGRRPAPGRPRHGADGHGRQRRGSVTTVPCSTTGR